MFQFQRQCRRALELLFKSEEDEKLEFKYKDHQLCGKYESFRDCHVAPDVLLIYKKIGKDTLVLERIGSHAQLF